jgi:hypothetical protein
MARGYGWAGPAFRPIQAISLLNLDVGCAINISFNSNDT